MNSNLKLGNTANLLFGLRPHWADSTRVGFPYFNPPGKSINTTEINVNPDLPGTWSDPEISIHDCVEDIIDEIFDYRVHLVSLGSRAFEVPASLLMLGDENRDETLSELSELLGIDLGLDQTGGYMLVKMQRTVATAIHEADEGGIGRRIDTIDYWTREGIRAMARLRVSEKIYDGAERHGVVTASEAQRYIDYFYDFGTHFLSRIELGDIILQVFRLKSTCYRQFKDQFIQEAAGSRITGSLAYGLRCYTSPEWVESRGNIVIASGDPDFEDSLRSGQWHDENFAKGDSMLSPQCEDAEVRNELCSRFKASVPITLKFISQSPYMEAFRTSGWNRLLRGAFLQRFGDRIPIPDEHRHFHSGTKYFPINHSFPAVTKPVMNNFFDKLDARECHFVNKKIVEYFITYALIFDFTKTLRVRLPGKRVILSAYQIEACREDGKVPVITISDEAFKDYQIYTRRMHGAFFVTNQSNTQQETILGGLRFSDGLIDEQTGRCRVIISGDLQMPSKEFLPSLVGFMESSLEIAESLIFSQLLRQQDSDGFIEGYLEWLAQMLSISGKTQKLRVKVLYLSRMIYGLATNRKHSYLIKEVVLPPEKLLELRTLAAETEQLDLQMQDSKFRKLQGDVSSINYQKDVSEFWQEFTGSFKLVGNRLEEVLSDTYAVDDKILESITRRVERLKKQTESAHLNLQSAVQNLKANISDHTCSSFTGVILNALLEILSSKHFEDLRRPPIGEESFTKFWFVLFKIQNANSAIEAIELLSKTEEGQSLDQIEQILDTLDICTELPSLLEWQDLPKLVIKLIDADQSSPQIANLESALESLAVPAHELLATRALRSQLILNQNIWWRKRSSNSSNNIDHWQMPNLLIYQKWHISRLLLELWNWIDGGKGSKALGNVALLEDSNLAGISRSLSEYTQDFEKTGVRLKTRKDTRKICQD